MLKATMSNTKVFTISRIVGSDLFSCSSSDTFSIDRTNDKIRTMKKISREYFWKSPIILTPNTCNRMQNIIKELITKTEIGNAFSFFSSSATLDTLRANESINRT